MTIKETPGEKNARLRVAISSQGDVIRALQSEVHVFRGSVVELGILVSELRQKLHRRQVRTKRLCTVAGEAVAAFANLTDFGDLDPKWQGELTNAIKVLDAEFSRESTT